MLIYHPAQDANHCVFRTLLLLEHTTQCEMDLELYRLLDFYILFPHLLKFINPLPAGLRSYKKILSKIPEPFETMRNTKRIMHVLEPLQTMALHSLLAKQIIDIESYKNKLIKRTDEQIPTELDYAIKNSELAESEWFRMVVNELPFTDFLGPQGLKKRAGLMEFRYDTEFK
jgi:hypothetical protein